MSDSYELAAPKRVDLQLTGVPKLVARGVDIVNNIVIRLGMVALLAASAILTYSVFSRYFFMAATDWQDEAAVFCLVAATFLSGSYVQSCRGHVGIEALAAVLSPRANRIRLLLVDIASALFCGFFAWKSWTLWHEARMQGYTTSSSWAPPLWIPYFLMAAGMTLLTLQILLQIAAHFVPQDAGQ